MGCPQTSHKPYVPSSIRLKASSTWLRRSWTLFSIANPFSRSNASLATSARSSSYPPVVSMLTCSTSGRCSSMASSSSVSRSRSDSRTRRNAASSFFESARPAAALDPLLTGAEALPVLATIRTGRAALPLVVLDGAVLVGFARRADARWAVVLETRPRPFPTRLGALLGILEPPDGGWDPKIPTYITRGHPPLQVALRRVRALRWPSSRPRPLLCLPSHPPHRAGSRCSAFPPSGTLRARPGPAAR